jgi:hypothetical protein
MAKLYDVAYVGFEDFDQDIELPEPEDNIRWARCTNWGGELLMPRHGAWVTAEWCPECRGKHTAKGCPRCQGRGAVMAKES